MTRRRSSAAARVASRRADAARAAGTPHAQVPTADAREQVPADVRQVATGYRKPKRRDTSRRAIAVTCGGWSDHLPANVLADGTVSPDAQRGFAAADARRWRGEARSTRPTPRATDARLILTDAMPSD